MYLGDGVQLPELGQIQGPAFVGNYSKIEPGARIGAYSVLGQNAVVKDGAQIERSVIDSGSYIGQSARIEGAILGKGVDVRAHAVVNEGVAIGDECSIGSQSVLAPNVKVYPFKTIEAGAAIHSNLIWESRGITTLFGRDEVSGLVNVDITPDVASRIGMAYGTTLARDARIVVSRDANPAARMIKRSLISGFAATGVNVSDLRVAMPAVARHQLKIDERAGGVHVQISPDDPEVVEIRFFEAPGILVSDATIKSIERTYSRQEFRRVSATEIGRLSYPSRATEIYVQDLLEILDVAAIRSRGFRMVLNYAHSPASLVVPNMIGDLGVELISMNAPVDVGDLPTKTHEQSLAETAQMVRAVGAAVGVLLDIAGERIWLVDETGQPIPAETTLLLLLRELSAQTAIGTLLVPVTETYEVEHVVNGSSNRVERTEASLHALLLGGHRGGRAVRGRIRRRLRVSRLPARIRRAGVDRKGARDPGPLAGHAVGAGLEPARDHARAHPGTLPVGGQGHRHAAADRIHKAAAHRPHGRAQGVREGRVGAADPRPRRTGVPHLRRGTHAGGLHAAGGEVPRHVGGDRHRPAG